jgi:hypothetical protein
MSGMKRVLFIVVVVAVLAGGLTLAVVGGGPQSQSATSLGSFGGGGTPQVAAGTGTPTPIAGLNALVVDPAKQEPVLDKFTSKDPFAPLNSPSPTATPTATPTNPVSAPVSASVSISGSKYTVKEGDETPTSDPAFAIADITSAGVTFELLNGMQFDDGSTSVEVAVGQVAVVTTADTGETFSLGVNQLNYAGEPTSSPSPWQGHSIKLLSINTQDGTDSATFKVDGTTFADELEGDVFATDWGQIKVLAIDAAAQTVTILHGDETYVLHVGQTLEK